MILTVRTSRVMTENESQAHCFAGESMTNSPAIGTTGRQSSVHKFGVTLSKDQFQAELGRMNLVRASEIDGEESDGTPKHWRNRPFVSKRQIEALIERMYDVPQTPDSSAVDAGARHAIVQIAALADA